jgi:hypothetical protein
LASFQQFATNRSGCCALLGCRSIEHLRNPRLVGHPLHGWRHGPDSDIGLRRKPAREVGALAPQLRYFAAQAQQFASFYFGQCVVGSRGCGRGFGHGGKLLPEPRVVGSNAAHHPVLSKDDNDCRGREDDQNDVSGVHGLFYETDRSLLCCHKFAM